MTLRPVAYALLLALLTKTGLSAAQAADDTVEFNTEVLDVEDRSHLNLSQFSQAGYVMPGTYSLALQVNQSHLPERDIAFFPPENDPKQSEACLTAEMVDQLGLTDTARKQVSWWHQGQCMDPASIKGLTLRGDIGAGVLYVTLPQSNLEYASDNWDPPSRWDNGIPGLLFDYNLNAQATRQVKGGRTQNASGNGTTGINIGAWRLRADWQAQYEHTTGRTNSSRQNWDWSRFYIYRAISSLRAKLTVGEDYLNSGLFDNFRFVGASLVSDDNMLPPNLRGYAPEVVGVAKTNARVTVSQQGRVIYETTVAAGPFRIQGLSNAVVGKLDVKVQEQDGSVNSYQMETANVPYLTRPGLVRYKISAGKPSTFSHNSEGPVFGVGEFSWGVNNGWSLFGGAMLAGEYNALTMGVGRDLLMLGALSFDITQSRASIPDDETKSGRSYHLSYSKRFDETDSQVTFAGYRFSERDFMSMSEYLNRRYHTEPGSSAGSGIGSGKELYTLTFNQQFRSLNLSAYLNYSHQTYWDRPESNTYNLSISRYFDIGQFKNVSLSLSAYRTKQERMTDDGVYLSLSLPWGSHGMLSYDGQFSKGNSGHTVGYSDQIDDSNNYRLSAGIGQDSRATGSGFLTHYGELAEVSATAAFQGSEYSSVGMLMRGGMTATMQGAALHRASSPGGTRMLVDTGGVGGVPINGGDGQNKSNGFGKAVVSDISSYYRSSISVDLNKLGSDVEMIRSVVEGTLTEGAIGYRRFGVVAGQKAMAIIKLVDGSTPPFGATVVNAGNIQTGMVSDGGDVWLSGIKPGETMTVNWEGQTQCHITLPSPLPADMQSQRLLLPCVMNRD
ncbi:outer membrane usher protein [Rouxiella sp. Mn2063]|uniref:outer membrane usher protein n=1 Tax=Rouxiella sp. Mn2063 TaxID=3395262 RepID=UPI003BC99AB7